MRKKSYKKSAKSNAALIKRRANNTLAQISKRKSTSKQPTTGLTSTDITFYSQHKDELRKLIKINNQRISRLSKKGLLDMSFAYQKISPVYLTESGKIRGTLKGLDPEEIRKLIEVNLKFATSVTITAKGISNLRSEKQKNLIKQLINHADISLEDRNTLETYLNSLSADEFAEVSDAYSYLLSKQFSQSSDQRFLLVAQDIVQKARMMHEEDAAKIIQHARSNVMRAQAKEMVSLKDINIDSLTDEELSRVMKEIASRDTKSVIKAIDDKKNEEYQKIMISNLSDEDYNNLSPVTQDAIDEANESPALFALKRRKRKATFTKEDLKKIFS